MKANYEGWYEADARKTHYENWEEWWNSLPAEEDNTIDDLIAIMVEEEVIDGAALGVCKLILDRGVDALSEKQKWVLHYAVEPYLVFTCKDCGDFFTFAEMFEAWFDQTCEDCWQDH
jgi:hypothetical protein